MSTCRGIVVAGSPGGTRMVTGCHQQALSGKEFCGTHQREEDYRHRRMEQMLAEAMPRLTQPPRRRAMSVKAKFRCSYIDEPLYLKKAREEHPDGQHEPSKVIHFQAVKAEDGDNAEWSKWTPSGDIQMYVTNPAAFEQFEQGKDYILTFQPA